MVSHVATASPSFGPAQPLFDSRRTGNSLAVSTRPLQVATAKREPRARVSSPAGPMRFTPERVKGRLVADKRFQVPAGCKVTVGEKTYQPGAVAPQYLLQLASGDMELTKYIANRCQTNNGSGGGINFVVNS